MSNDVTTKENNAIAGVNSNAGFDMVDDEEIKIPTAKIMQGQSPELKDNDDIEAGDIIHSITKQALDSLEFVPALVWKSQTLFVPRNKAEAQIMEQDLNELGYETNDVDFDNDMIICQAKDGKRGTKYGNCKTCPLAKWNNNKPPMCTATWNILAVFENTTYPMIIRFMRTNFKHGNSFVNQARYLGDIYANKYELVPVEVSGDEYDWYEMKVKPAGKPDDEWSETAKNLYLEFRNSIADVEVADDEGAPDEAPTTEASSDEY